MSDHDQGLAAPKECVPTLGKLGDRIQALEKAAAEPERPWYKQAANLLSVLAVVAATAAVIQTHLEQKGHELEDLQQIAVDIVENQKAISELQTKTTDAVSSANIQGPLAEKGNTLLARGIELLKDYDGDTTPDVLYVLGYQAASNGNYVEAESLLMKAIDEADSPLSKFGPRELSAQLYMVPGTSVFSVSQGEKMYSDALTSVASSKDPAFIYDAGFLNENWAKGEFQVENVPAGLQKLADAERSYQSLPRWNQNRFSAIERVRQLRSKLIQDSGEGQKLAERLSGQWVVLSGSLRGLPATSTLAVKLDQDSGLMSASLLQKATGLDSLGLRMQQDGPVLIKDLHTAEFDWQGSDQLLGSLTGTTTLTFDDSLTSIAAVEQRSDQVVTKYTLAKPASLRK